MMKLVSKTEHSVFTFFFKTAHLTPISTTGSYLKSKCIMYVCNACINPEKVQNKTKIRKIIAVRKILLTKDSSFFQNSF